MPTTFHGTMGKSESWGESLGRGLGGAADTLVEFYLKQRLLEQKYNEEEKKQKQELQDKLDEHFEKMSMKEYLLQGLGEVGAESEWGRVYQEALESMGKGEAAYAEPKKKSETKIETETKGAQLEQEEAIKRPYSYKKWKEGKLAMDAADKYFEAGEPEKGWTAYRQADSLFKESQLHSEAEVEKAGKQKEAELSVEEPYRIRAEKRAEARETAKEQREKKLTGKELATLHDKEVGEIDSYHQKYVGKTDKGYTPMEGASTSGLVGKVSEINERRKARGVTPLRVRSADGSVINPGDPYPVQIIIEEDKPSAIGAVFSAPPYVPGRTGATPPSAPAKLGGGWKVL